jgi:hypothetical protein
MTNAAASSVSIKRDQCWLTSTPIGASRVDGDPDQAAFQPSGRGSEVTLLGMNRDDLIVFF